MAFDLDPERRDSHTKLMWKYHLRDNECRGCEKKQGYRGRRLLWAMEVSREHEARAKHCGTILIR